MLDFLMIPKFKDIRRRLKHVCGPECKIAWTLSGDELLVGLGDNSFFLVRCMDRDGRTITSSRESTPIDSVSLSYSIDRSDCSPSRIRAICREFIAPAIKHDCSRHSEHWLCERSFSLSPDCFLFLPCARQFACEAPLC